MPHIRRIINDLLCYTLKAGRSLVISQTLAKWRQHLPFVPHGSMFFRPLMSVLPLAISLCQVKSGEYIGIITGDQDLPLGSKFNTQPNMLLLRQKISDCQYTAVFYAIFWRVERYGVVRTGINALWSLPPQNQFYMHFFPQKHGIVRTGQHFNDHVLTKITCRVAHCKTDSVA